MASCVCTLRRLLQPSSSCFVSIPSAVVTSRLGHVASSKDAVSGGGGAVAKGSPSSGVVGPEDKRVDQRKESRAQYVWAPDPETGYYRPIDQATEAQENAFSRKN